MEIKYFAEAFTYRGELETAQWDELLALQANVSAAVVKEARARFPRRRFTDDKAYEILGKDAVNAIRAPFQTQADALHKQHKAALDLIDDRLMVFAKMTDVPRLDPSELTKVDESFASNWSSQGYGASKYAEADAESKADVARMLGLVAEVRPTKRRMTGGQWPVEHVDFGVWINTTPMGWEVAQRKGVRSLRDWVRMCWKRGVNPRVYQPFLPHGYEEEQGLSYFGDDLRTKETA